MTLFDKRYKAVLRDEFGLRDISDELNTLAAVELALERADFQMLPAECSGIESVANEARIRLIKRYIKGQSLTEPAFIDLYKDGEVISVQAIDDMTLKINQNYASFQTKEHTLWNKIVADKDTKFPVTSNTILQDNVRVYSLRGNYISAGGDLKQWVRGYSNNHRRGAYTLPMQDGGNTVGYPLLDAEGIDAPDNVKIYWINSASTDTPSNEQWSKVIFAPAYQQLRLRFDWDESYKMWGLSWNGDRLWGVPSVSISTAKNLGIAVMYWRRGSPEVEILPEWICQLILDKHPDTAPSSEDYRDDYRFKLPDFNHITFETPLFTEDTYFWLAVRVGYNSGNATYSATPPLDQTSNTSYGWQASGRAENSEHIRITANGVAGSIALIRGVPASTIQHAVNEVVRQIDNTATVQWDLRLMQLNIDRRWTELLVNPAAFDPNTYISNDVKHTIRVSIFDLLKTLDVNYCIGIEELPGNRLRITDRRNVLRPAVKQIISDYTDLQIEVDSQRFFNKISAGSDKGIDKDVQGRQDFHGLVEYTIPKTRDKDVIYDLKQVYYTNPLGISNYLVERNKDNDDNDRDNPKDMDIFVFCGWRKSGSAVIPYDNSLFYIYKNSSSTQFPHPELVKIETSLTPEQMEISTEIYNVPISPRRTIERHANFLSGVIHFFRDNTIFERNVTQATQDFRVNTYLTRVEITNLRNEKPEQYDIYSAEPFTRPVKVSFQTDLTFADKLNFEERNNPLAVKTDLLDTSDYTFFPRNNEILVAPMGVSFNLCENTVSEVSGQLLTDAMDNYYLSNICKPNILQL